MSVSLALIPVALTLRLVMGKNNFEGWVHSMQVRMPTTFRNELELVRTVRKAGYDAEKWGGLIKTHVDGERFFFFWELIDGKWTAVFGKSDPQHLIAEFMADVNRAAGKVAIGTEETLRASAEAAAGTVAAAAAPPVAAPPVFPTNFRDGDLLFRTLKEFGVNPQRSGSDIVCTVQQSVLTFRASDNGPYQVEIRNAPDLRQMFDYLSDVDEDYRRCLQSVLYEKLKDRAAARNMTVESEEVLEDNSIVVTLNIRS